MIASISEEVHGAARNKTHRRDRVRQELKGSVAFCFPVDSDKQMVLVLKESALLLLGKGKHYLKPLADPVEFLRAKHPDLLQLRFSSDSTRKQELGTSICPHRDNDFAIGVNVPALALPCLADFDTHASAGRRKQQSSNGGKGQDGKVLPSLVNRRRQVGR